MSGIHRDRGDNPPIFANSETPGVHYIFGTIELGGILAAIFAAAVLAGLGFVEPERCLYRRFTANLAFK